MCCKSLKNVYIDEVIFSHFETQKKNEQNLIKSSEVHNYFEILCDDGEKKVPYTCL